MRNKMKKIIIACALLLLIGNEVISWAVLCVLAFAGMIKLLKVAAEGGAFD